MARLTQLMVRDNLLKRRKLHGSQSCENCQTFLQFYSSFLSDVHPLGKIADYFWRMLQIYTQNKDVNIVFIDKYISANIPETDETT